MANTNIWIEEKETNRWVAEVEAGGSTSIRRQSVTAQTLSDLLVAIELKYAELRPAPVARPASEIAADQAAVKKKMDEIAEEEARAVRDAERIADDAAVVRVDAQARAQQESDRLGREVETIKAREAAEHREVPRTPSPAPLNSSEARVDDARQSVASPLPPAPGLDRVGGMREREIDSPPSQPTTDMRPTAQEAAQAAPATPPVGVAGRVSPAVASGLDTSDKERDARLAAITQQRSTPLPPLTPAETKRLETLRARRDADRTPAERQELRDLARRAVG